MNTTATRKYIETLTATLSQKEGVRFTEGTNWSVNLKTKTLSYPMEELLTLDYIEARGLLLHETGHLKYTELLDPTPIEKEFPVIHEIYNVFEDARIERKLCDEYGDYSKEGLATAFMGAVDTLKDNMDKEKTDLDKVLLSSLVTYDCNQSPYSAYVDSTTDNNVREMNMGFYSKELSLYNLSGEIREKINYGSYSATHKELRDYVDKEVIPLLKDLIKKSPVNSDVSKSMKKSNRGVGLCKKHKTGGTSKIPTNEEIESLLYPYINSLAYKIKNILKETATIKYSGSYKTGRLLSKNCYKVLTGESRIFSKRKKLDKHDYKFTILLDNSGSMRGNKQVNTYIGAYLILSVCKKVGIKTNLIKYNDWITELDSIDGYRPNAGGGNDDYLACEHIEKNLNPDENNVVIILTDGDVCNDPKEPLDRIKKLGASVFAIGVGLGSDDTEKLSYYYPNPISVPDVSDIPNQLLAVMSKVIHR